MFHLCEMSGDSSRAPPKAGRRKAKVEFSLRTEVYHFEARTTRALLSVAGVSPNGEFRRPLTARSTACGEFRPAGGSLPKAELSHNCRTLDAMPLPEVIPVKLSTEDAGAISITPVIRQTLSVQDLVERMLELFGKDESRLLDLLKHGVLVSGATRYRWGPLHEAELGDLRELLKRFPDPDPTRSFDAGRLVKVLFAGEVMKLEITRKTGSRRRWFRRQSFWDRLSRLLAESSPEYVTYSYREKADEYWLPVLPELDASLRKSAQLLYYSGQARWLQTHPCVGLILFAER